MPVWKKELDLSPHYAEAKGHPEKLPDLAALVAKRLDRLRFEPSECADRRDALSDMFASASTDAALDVEYFDEMMADLYDWADEYRVWIETRRSRKGSDLNVPQESGSSGSTR